MIDPATEPVRREVYVADRRLSYLEAGPVDGPVVLLLHGMLSEATTWQPAIGPLAGHGVRVIALDLIGHGRSDKPPLEYSLFDFAENLSAFVSALELGTVTVAGHSLGGAIAIQFAHSHPNQTDRLVVVSSGGLGKQVHFILRAATLPGTGRFLRATVNRRTARLYSRPELHRALRLPPEAVVNLGRIGQTLMTDEGRSTFVSAVRSVITPTGQLGNMLEHGYVDPDLPTLIVWSANDPIIPVSHAVAAHEQRPNSRLEVFEGATHEPHRREPERFAAVLADFIAQTNPAPPAAATR